ncbi:MAG: WD40/YVTN/BNR-like repeat-containing protein, partial [Thermoanaerobaculia bacterium]
MRARRMAALGAMALTLTLFGTAGLAAQGPGTAEETGDESRMTESTFKGLELRSIGPAFMSGRIADIAIHPEDRSTWYVAVGSGGVWKTTNAGTTWTPIFDHEGSYSIGCLTLDPNDPDTIWVGTGENVGGRHVGYGDGVYRSRDGGASWEHLGLEDSEHIGSISIDPRDSDVVYVAAQGPLWSAGGERGLYKTTDGGESWEKLLGDEEYTGVNEAVMNPEDPDVLYAATHQRYRNVAALIDGGPGSGIHKTTDGGETWRELTKGLPQEDMGRIGLALSPQDPDVVYATIELARREGGFYRSTDGGASWEKRNDYISGGTGPHYYQELYASPHQKDRVYQADVRMQVTHDGGKTFESADGQNKHSDNHALAFVPDDPDYLLAGTDGGLYESFDLGETWKFVANLPVTQFYKVAVDNDEPVYHVYGGTQDNSTQGGPSRTLNVNGIRNSDWFITVFADGHQPAVDPENPDIVYSEWQEGNLVRYDRRTGEIVYIQPQAGPGEEGNRWNWDSPILVSPHDPARLYFASQRVWRSDDRGDSWRAISGDLSRGRERLELPMMGRTWSVDALWDLSAMSNYANVTSLAESPHVEGLIYAGTDDGLVQVTEDGGETWRTVEKLPGVPEETFVNDIKADLHDPDTVYVALDNHKRGDFAPYLLESNDRGRTWHSIAGDLPERHIVWRLVQDHEEPDLLFAGTEFGVFFSRDGGGRWIELEGGVPQIAFRDLAIQKRENDLVGATFGRGFYVLDDYTPLRLASEELFEEEAALFPIRDAWWYVPRRPLGGGGKASQGDAFFLADNPP